ncbi:hypothetical protein [Pararhizobium sp. A13]|uniref:hypothetical protein n=1 Tax=Pararhizobium sp. A13 TaxID=3133975 RepID=UPI00311B2BE0
MLGYGVEGMDIALAGATPGSLGEFQALSIAGWIAGAVPGTSPGCRPLGAKLECNPPIEFLQRLMSWRDSDMPKFEPRG